METTQKIKETIKQKYTKAVPISELIEEIISNLNQNNISINHCVPATCLCRDESTSQLINELKNKNFKNNFNLEALGGVPLAGNSSLNAYYKHLHNQDSINYPGIIIFAPHIGIDNNLSFGYLNREGQDSTSCSCGANHAIINHIKNNTEPEKNDYELKNLYEYIGDFKEEIKTQKDIFSQINLLVEKEYEKGNKDFKELIQKIKNQEKEKHKILLVSGVHIDTPPNLENYFDIREMIWL